MTKATLKAIQDGRVVQHHDVDGNRKWVVLDTVQEALRVANEMVAAGKDANILRQQELPGIDWRQKYIDRPLTVRRTGKSNGHGNHLLGRFVRVRHVDNGRMLEGFYSNMGDDGNKIPNNLFRINVSNDSKNVFRYFHLPKKNWVVVWWDREGVDNNG